MEAVGELWEELPCDGLVNEGGLDGVADGGVVGFGVVDDGECECLIGVRVNEDVADAVGVAEDGDTGVGLDMLDESAGAAGDDEVDEPGEMEEFGDLLAAEDESDGVGWDAGSGEGVADDVDESGGGALDLFAGLEEDGVAGLECEGGDLSDGVGAGLEDDGEDAEGDGDFFKVEAAVELDGVEAAAEWIGEGRYGAKLGYHLGELVRGKGEAGLVGGGELARGDEGVGGREIFGVRGEDGDSRRFEGLGNSFEGRVAVFGGERGEGVGGVLCCLGHRASICNGICSERGWGVDACNLICYTVDHWASPASILTGRKVVPTGVRSAAWRQIRSRTWGVRPLAMMAVRPAAVTMRAASSLEAMPPRPRPLPPWAWARICSVMAGTTGMRVAAGSAGLRSKRPSTSERRTRRSASMWVMRRAESLSLSPKMRSFEAAPAACDDSAGRSSSRVETVSFSLTMGMTPSERRAWRVRRRLAWRVGSRKSSSVRRTWAMRQPRRSKASS